MDHIASLTPWSRHALFLPRDKHGRLIRHDSDLPDHVKVDENGMRVISGKPVPLSEAYRQVNRRLGFTDQQIRDGWKKFEADNPQMGIAAMFGKKPRGK